MPSLLERLRAGFSAVSETFSATDFVNAAKTPQEKAQAMTDLKHLGNMTRGDRNAVIAKAAAPLAAKSSKPVAKTPPSSADLGRLRGEVDDLLALATRAVANVRSIRAQAERKALKGLSGLALTRAATRDQLKASGLSDPADRAVTQDVPGICRRSLPENNPPAWTPEPSRDIRLKESNAYYSELLKQLDDEIDEANRKGLIPQSLLAARRRVNEEWILANDKILGRDVRNRE